jgi:hypothetical protein
VIFLISAALTFFSYSAAQASLTISSVALNGYKALPGDPISATPIISVTATSTNAVTGRITLGGTTTSVTLVNGGSNNYYGTLEVSTALADGTYALTAEVFASIGGGATFEVVPLYVQTKQDLVVQGRPLNYPNPFNPSLAGSTKISYMLSKAANITLSIHDLFGTPVTKMSFNSGTNGGLAGYNAVTWNGRSDAGQVAGNGIYVYIIIGEGKVLAKGKLMVLKK